jgi:hypothetical protein
VKKGGEGPGDTDWHDFADTKYREIHSEGGKGGRGGVRKVWMGIQVI